MQITFWQNCVCASTIVYLQGCALRWNLCGSMIYFLQLRNHLYHGKENGTSLYIIGIYLAIYPDKWANT